MSKKKEIKPVELCIESDDVVKRYPITEAIEIVRCKTSFFFHSTGFFVVSKPTLANNMQGGALFETLRWYCDYMDSRENCPQDEQEKFDTVAAMVANILSLPLDVFTDMDFMIDVADQILRMRNEYYERLQKEAAEPKQDSLEDELENVAFEGEVLALEQLANDAKTMTGKKDGTDGTAS